MELFTLYGVTLGIKMEAQKVATDVVRRLVAAGYETYFAGGWVRDYLLDHPRSDIDLATAASPEEVMALFSHTFAVGAQFGVVLVIEGGHQFEVSSFRRDGLYVDGRRPDSIEYASAQEDVQRRDFTINGMFYDPLSATIHDWVGGQSDLKKGVIRAIGVASDRFREDRLRMLRAVRMACRFRFFLDSETEKAIIAHAHTLLPAVAIERIWGELQKMATSPHFRDSLMMLYRLGLLQEIFPVLRGEPLSALAERLKALDRMPASTPVIAQIAELFVDFSRDENVQLAEHLRTSRADLNFLLKLSEGRQLVEREQIGDLPRSVEWVRYYAQDDAYLCLAIIHARYGEVDVQMEKHRKRAEKYAFHIDCIQRRSPVVGSERLKNEGIVPGKLMGKLLRDAEEIAIEELLCDPDRVMALLRATPVWPGVQK